MGLLSIKIRIGDRYYPMEIKVEDEPLLRRVSQIINEKIKIYEKKYNHGDIQDILSIICFDLMAILLKNDESFKKNYKDQLNEVKSLQEKLLKLVEFTK